MKEVSGGSSSGMLSPSVEGRTVALTVGADGVVGADGAVGAGFVTVTTILDTGVIGAGVDWRIGPVGRRLVV